MGEPLRVYYQKKLGLTDGEFTKLNQAATELETTLALQDSKAKAFIANERKNFPDGKLPSRDALPKVP